MFKTVNDEQREMKFVYHVKNDGYDLSATLYEYDRNHFYYVLRDNDDIIEFGLKEFTEENKEVVKNDISRKMQKYVKC